MENIGQLIIDMKKSLEVSLDSKDSELISMDKQEFSFDMGWVGLRRAH